MRRLILLAPIVLAVATRPAAAITCDTLPNVVYLQTGDTQLNLLMTLGRAMRDNSHPVTMVYATGGSCTNIDNFYNHNAIITANMKYSPSIAEVATWNPATDAPLQCTPPGTGIFPDIGNSIVFNTSCAQGAAGPPNTVLLTTGPTQSFVFGVPKGLTGGQTAITFEEAYFVFGFGSIGAVMPWIDETQVFIRTVTKGTEIAIAAAIAVPPSQWKAPAVNQFANSSDVVAHLQAATSTAAIGILGAEVYDPLRSTITSLAFRAPGQYAAYFPDSTSTSFDKKNVRDGHYYLWSPTTWMLNVPAGSTTPSNVEAQYVVDIIDGNPVTPAPNFDADALIARLGLVPACAMHVSRALEGGPLSLNTPAAECTCAYEAAVDHTTCAACDATTPCATGVCRGNFCEAH
jgi:hypothetical protein